MINVSDFTVNNYTFRESNSVNFMFAFLSKGGHFKGKNLLLEEQVFCFNGNLHVGRDSSSKKANRKS